MPPKVHQALLAACPWDNQPHRELAWMQPPKPWRGWVPCPAW